MKRILTTMCALTLLLAASVPALAAEPEQSASYYPTSAEEYRQSQLLLGRQIFGNWLGLPLGPAHQGMGSRQLDYWNLPALRARLQWIRRLGIL